MNDDPNHISMCRVASRRAFGRPAALRRLVFAGLLCGLLLSAAPAAALRVPPLTGRINDLAGMLSPATARQLEAILAKNERGEGAQIAVLTIESLEGENLEDFSLRVAEQWGLGRKGVDNGVLLLVARQERKIRIEVGYGLEGRLTDLLAGRIIRHVIAPEFKRAASIWASSKACGPSRRPCMQRHPRTTSLRTTPQRTVRPGGSGLSSRC